MALDLALSRDHDLDVGLLGELSFIEGAERISQQVKVTLLAFLGEWFLDTSFGVPYFESILVKSPDRASIEAVLRARIRAVPGVDRVRRLDLDIERELRILRVTFDADTAAGRIERAVELRAS